MTIADNEHKHGYKDKVCGIVNFYCGDGGGDKPDHPHHDKAKCCDSCDSAEKGKSFVGFGDTGFITPVSTDIATELLVNPAGSGKLLYIKKRMMTAIGNEEESILFKFYFDPVVNAAGIPGSITALNQSLATQASVAQIYSNPNIGAVGLSIDAASVSSTPYENEELIILGEGHSLLVTARSNSENYRATVFFYWTECVIPQDLTIAA